jgi:hypothetical protein
MTEDPHSYPGPPPVTALDFLERGLWETEQAVRWKLAAQACPVGAPRLHQRLVGVAVGYEDAARTTLDRVRAALAADTALPPGQPW